MKFSIVVATDKDGGIGLNKNNQYSIPWSNALDMKFFKDLTSSKDIKKVIIMGKNTYFSLPIDNLPNRTNIVITSNPSLITNKDVFTFTNLNEALKFSKQFDEIYVIGGSQLYKEALKHESFIHELYDEYRKMGEWFTFDRHFFTQKVLPQMVDYFSNIEIIEGKVASTNLQLEELNYNLDNIIEDDYVSRKIRLTYLEKCLVVDDTKRDFYKKEIEKLNQGFKLEKELAIKKGQEKAHKEYVRRYIYKNFCSLFTK